MIRRKFSIFNGFLFLLLCHGIPPNQNLIEANGSEAYLYSLSPGSNFSDGHVRNFLPKSYTTTSKIRNPFTGKTKLFETNAYLPCINSEFNTSGRTNVSCLMAKDSLQKRIANRDPHNLQQTSNSFQAQPENYLKINKHVRRSVPTTMSFTEQAKIDAQRKERFSFDRNDAKNGTIMRRYASPADMLSRNISIILENLLKSYEQSQLPTHGRDVPTVVRTNILIRSMGPVSEMDMDYSMDCYFRQYWRDERLSFQGPIKSLSLSIKMLDKIWRPDTYFFNGKHSHIHTITVPNKLLRLDQDGGILYSMRLTIKATCPMELKNFPMDLQSCPLIIGSYGYTSRQLVYEWKNHDDAVSFVPGMTLNQFDLVSMMSRNLTYTRREGEFSVLHVAFNLKRHTGYFLIQVYVPCILIVVLSWVSFWIHREATSDRVGLCVTAVLTLSTISLDSRTDLPKVKYATALDWFLLMSFLYCIATLLEFAGVHYFTKLGSGEVHLSEDEWEDIAEDVVVENHECESEICSTIHSQDDSASQTPTQLSTNHYNKHNIIICPIYNEQAMCTPQSHVMTMEQTTQTETPAFSKSKQMWLCLVGDVKFRKQRERDAAAANTGSSRYVNSVSMIDRVARIGFPMSFALFNLLYWMAYGMYKKDFSWASVRG